jgi:N-acetylglutamate synthase-like GNAT family acetyltransferase
MVDIRRAISSDADGISSMIVRALRETNNRDYPPHVIAAVAENFSPERVATLLTTRQVYVAVVDGAIVGTASLDGGAIRSVYVDPVYQRRGIGTQLMDILENTAREQSIAAIGVPSSITAEGFYRKRGYVFVRDEFHGEERTIIMRKKIGNAS